MYKVSRLIHLSLLLFFVEEERAKATFSNKIETFLVGDNKLRLSHLGSHDVTCNKAAPFYS